MICYQLELAYESYQASHVPFILPLLFDSSLEVPESIRRIFNSFRPVHLEGSRDESLNKTKIIEFLRNPSLLRTSSTGAKIEAVGGAVPLDSSYYIARPADLALEECINTHESIVLLKGARQIGKTSLLARGLQKARLAGATVILTDYQIFNSSHLKSIDTLYLSLARSIAQQLDIDFDPEEIVHPRNDPTISFESFIRKRVLKPSEKGVIWGMDEVDRLFSTDFGNEVFGLFRSWHNARALNPMGRWSQLTMAISYATEAHLFITDINQSPFNVGTRLELHDFTVEQVQDLNERHGNPLKRIEEVMRFHELIGGHPYLTRKGLSEMVNQGLTLPAFIEQAEQEDGVYADHLRRILIVLAKDQTLERAMPDILDGNPCPDEDTFYRLRSAGILKGHYVDEAQPRCQLYAKYLQRHLRNRHSR
jgi:hypothetical protein